MRKLRQLYDNLKNCEGCKRRRSFLKQILAGASMILLFPFKSEAQLNCECTFCRNGSLCLCCDPSCDHCSISSRERCCVHVLEFCSGVPTYTAICCANGQCPGIDETGESKFKSSWEILMDGNNRALLLSSNDKLDVMDWLKSHSFHLKTNNGTNLYPTEAKPL